MIGFGDVHTRAHLYRAILEGLAYALREGKERTEKRSRVPITELRVPGAARRATRRCRSPRTSSACRRRPHLYETSGLGAAIDAAVGLGLHPDFDTAVRAMTRVGRASSRTPREAIYDQLYRRVYRGCTSGSSRSTRRFARSQGIRRPDDPTL